MPSAHLNLREEDVIRLALEFLHNRDLHISQLSIERETGVINGNYSDDVLFLRQLILDGQWDDVLEFIQPLSILQAFDMRRFCYVILTHKYIELLCIRSEAGLQNNMAVETAVDEVVNVLKEIEKYATKEEYSNLCLLLTLPRLSDHLLYKDWNPSNARVKCFREIYPLVEKFLISENRKGAAGSVVSENIQGLHAKNDRLIQLLIKGILYESCVNYCQAKATNSSSEKSEKSDKSDEMNFSNLLDCSIGFGDSDLSLLNWLQSIPADTFSVPFEQKTLNVDIERIERPSLETSWTEHMLITPIKPKTFPHSVMPFTRPRSAADAMSRSLHPSFDGLAYGLMATSSSQSTPQHLQNPRLMALSTGDINGPPSMSRSFASFHLNGNLRTPQNKNNMTTSVDRLFENENDVFLSNSYIEFQQLPSISEATGVSGSSSTPKMKTDGNISAPLSRERSPVHMPSKIDGNKGRESPNRSQLSRKNSLTDTIKSHNYEKNEKSQSSNQTGSILTERNFNTNFMATGDKNLSRIDGHDAKTDVMIDSFSGDLLKEYQKQKMKVQEAIVQRQREQDEFVRRQTREQHVQDNRFVDDSVRSANVNGRASVVSPNAPKLNNQNHQNGDVALGQNGLKSEGFYDQPSNRNDITNGSNGDGVDANKPKFTAVTALEDVQAVRCAEFHPAGKLYAVGSNSKTLRICAYPKLTDVKENHETYQPTVLFKRTKHHKGSIYCLAWSPMGDLLATGSNDKTVKLMRFNSDTSNLEGQEVELLMHDSTVRDLCFIEDTSNKSSLLISGGAGDCKIYVTDCETGTPFQALSGHSSPVLALYNWGGAIFVSGSQDKTVRFWDLRTRGCVNVVQPVTVPGTRQGSSVASLCVESSGRLLVSGHEDGCCALFDIRGNRPVQCFKPHTSDIRSVRFSPSAYYLLTGGYDNKLVLTDLQGDLTMPLPSVVVAQHQDKVISGRWHPSEFSFVSTSADKTAVLWALPPI